MTGSLLSFLASKISKYPQEDIASMSLCHIINQEDAPFLTSAFTEILCKSLGIERNVTISNYQTQVTGKEKERPDIVGFDQDGKEALICEVKFYAALTENQPKAYLKRLAEASGAGLVFLCPDNRVSGLWHQLCSIVGVEPTEDHHVIVDGVPMSIVSWKHILEKLNSVSESNHGVMQSDIQELTVFCKDIIGKEFIPFQEEDFGADIAIRIDRYFTIIDELNKYLINKEEFNINKGGFGSGRAKDVYAQYLKSSLCQLGLYFDRHAWKEPNSQLTPFWMDLQFSDWYQDEKIIAFLNTIPEWKKNKNYKGVIMIALKPPVGLGLEETIINLGEQVLKNLRDYQTFLEKMDG